MIDKYTECPECGHHRTMHNNSGGHFQCGLGLACECTKSQKDIDAYVATFDTRTCELCGLGNVDQGSGGIWRHRDVHSCMRTMGKKIIEMEREMFSRRSAIRDQKEKQNGKQ